MAAKKQPKPELSYITQLRAALEVLYRGQDEQIDEMRKVRTLTDDVQIPAQLKRVDAELHDPTAGDEMTRVGSSLSINMPTLRCTPTGHSDEAIENATLREHWTMQVLWEAATRVPGQHTFRMCMDAAVSDGGGWSKLLYYKDAWEERWGIRLAEFEREAETQEPDPEPDPDEEDDLYELRREMHRLDRTVAASNRFDEAVEAAKMGGGPPVIWIPVDVRTVYPVWTGSKITEVLEVSQRPTLSVCREYGLGVGANGDLVENLGVPLSLEEAQKLGTHVDFIEHWTDEWVTYVVCAGRSEKEVKQFRHGYGRQPYLFNPGMMPNHFRGRKVGWGVGQSKRYLVQFRNFLLTLLANQAAADAGAPLVEEIDPSAPPTLGEDGKEITHETWELSEIIRTPGKLHPLFQQPLSPSFMQLLQSVSTLIEQVDTPRVPGQIGGGLEGAGFAINTVLAEARTKHSPYMLGAEQMLGELTRFLWHLAKTVVKVQPDEKIWVKAPERRGKDKKKRGAGWLGLSPNDLKDQVGIQWTLNPEQPSAKLIETRWLTERVQAGRLSRDQAIEEEGENPDEVRLGIARDEWRMSPWYKAMQQIRVFTEMGARDMMGRLADTIAKTGIVPGMPPEVAGQVMAQQMLSKWYAQMLQGTLQPPPPAAPAGMGTEGIPSMPTEGAPQLPPTGGPVAGGEPQVREGSVAPQLQGVT